MEAQEQKKTDLKTKLSFTKKPTQPFERSEQTNFRP
jgi:hypothetical protein